MGRRREPPAWTTSLVRLLALAVALVIARGVERRPLAPQAPDAVRAAVAAEWTTPSTTPAIAGSVRRLAGATDAHRFSPVTWGAMPLAPTSRRIDAISTPAVPTRVARLEHRKTCTFPRREAGEPPRLRATGC